ncbi:hypothetical protein PENTCL1PPCAC_12646, partial [Pristionchus entomophagus]
RYQSLFWACLGIAAVLIYIGLMTESSNDYNDIMKSFPEIGIYGNIPEDEFSTFSNCTLAEFPEDGWTDEIRATADVDFNPIKDCDRSFSTFTILGDNGTVWMNSTKQGAENVVCKARTIFHKGEREVTYGQWSTVLNSASREIFNSDFVHTSCHTKDNETNIDEEFIHMQIWKEENNSTESEEKTKDERPSVFILVLDSVSTTQALRSLPKTIAMMREEFDVVNMRHLNKIGENSHPAAVASLIGKLMTDCDRGVFGMKKEPADWNETYACYHYLDDEPFIVKEFTKFGYKSLMAEDWATGVFNYPNCWGFKNQPTTHYNRPFQQHYEKDGEKSRKFMGIDQCFEPHTFLFNYMSKFINVYKDSPKIGFLWPVDLGHDDTDKVFHFDDQLLDWFKQHKEVMDKSYVFLMGDHGKRYGKTRGTWIGDREVSNPMLFVSVPKNVRKSINPILKKNSDQLMTHFDTYASLVDILNKNSQKGGVFNPQNLRGNSYFRPFPEGERSCRTLPIPFQFCLCEWDKTKSERSNLNKEIGDGAVTQLNKKLIEEKIAERCEAYTLKETHDVLIYDQGNGVTEINFVTEECGAEFRALVRVYRMRDDRLNVSLISNEFARRNAYGNTAKCMEDRPYLRPICCCRDRPKE